MAEPNAFLLRMILAALQLSTDARTLWARKCDGHRLSRVTPYEANAAQPGTGVPRKVPPIVQETRREIPRMVANAGETLAALANPAGCGR